MRFFPCARCGQKLQVAEDLRNMLLRCPLCTAEMPHPDAEPPEPVVLTLLPEAPARPAVATVAPRPALPPAADGPGRVLREFRGTGAWAGFGIFLAVTAGGILLAVLTGRSRNGYLIGLGLLIAGFGAVAAVLMLIRAFGATGARISVCEHGIICDQLGASDLCLWSEVTAVVYQKRTHGTQIAVQFGLLGYLLARLSMKRQLTLRRLEGPDVRLPEALSGVYRVYQMVCTGVRPWLLPAVEQALDQGQAVAFGEQVAIDAHGLRWVGQPLAWDDLGRVRLQFAANVGRGVLQALGQFKAPDIELQKIDNLDLLLEIMEQRFGVRVDRGKDVLS